MRWLYKPQGWVGRRAARTELARPTLYLVPVLRLASTARALSCAHTHSPTLPSCQKLKLVLGKAGVPLQRHPCSDLPAQQTSSAFSHVCPGFALQSPEQSLKLIGSVCLAPSSYPQASASRHQFNNSYAGGAWGAAGTGSGGLRGWPWSRAAAEGSPRPKGEAGRVGPRTGLGIGFPRAQLREPSQAAAASQTQLRGSYLRFSEQRESRIRYRLKLSAPNWLSCLTNRRMVPGVGGQEPASPERMILDSFPAPQPQPCPSP